MTISPAAKAIHGASTIKSVAVIRVVLQLLVLSRLVHPVLVRAR
jgi:hypothetical protein